MKTLISETQKQLFAMLEKSGELVFACGPKGAVANLVGHFKVAKNHHNEDQLDVGDGTCHVHIDWSRVKRFEVGEIHGEGLLAFYDGDEYLFRFYRMDGLFSDAIKKMSQSPLT
jgi:hypothetical protein